MSQTLVHQKIHVGTATLSVYLCGRGEAVVLLPSWARGAQDFAHLMAALATAGFQAIAVNPRGVDGSTGDLTELTYHDLAADAAGVIQALSVAPAHVVGHAYGNHLARCLAADHPALVQTVILLAAGGLIPVRREAAAALRRTLTEELSDAEWLTAMRTSGFFAPTSDPMVWRQGWWPSVAQAQVAIRDATPRDTWWAVGSAPILVIQGLEDQLAVPANGRALREAFGDRVQLIELAQAGHALLPEQLEAIAQAVVAFLQAHRSETTDRRANHT